MAVPALPQYAWLVVMGAFGAFGFGWGTGANDVANAFGTSVGAKTLTLRQATVIAAIFEFAGALLLGRVVTNTIAGGIADPKVFARSPEIYAYGMVCALAVGAIWQAVASFAGYNVSSTHTIIGGILGFALVYRGSSAVQWATPDPASFPPYKGVVPIIMSWFFSPVLTAASSALIFSVLRSAVLRRNNAYNLAFYVLPIAVFITTFINVFFVFTKGAAKTLGADFTSHTSAWLSAAIAGGCCALTAFVVVPLLRRRAAHVHAKADADAAAAAEAAANGLKDPSATMIAVEEASDNPADQPWYKRALRGAKAAALYGTSVDIHKAVEEDEMIAAIHAHAEKFDPKTEMIFGYLQVFSAIAVIFAHGAGEVGFMAGPLSAIYDIYMNGRLSKAVQSQIWCVALSAASLVIGLATYGYNVTRAMGISLAKLSPSRGFAAELSTALVILVASQLGLPTSSSQCITGGIVGVGLLEGAAKGVNWRQFGKQFASWVATLFVVGLGVAAIFAQGIYSPSKVDGDAVMAYEKDVAGLTSNIAGGLNETLLGFESASRAGLLRNLSPMQWTELNSTVSELGTKAANVTSAGTVDGKKLISALKQALEIVQNNSILTLGQNEVFPDALICHGHIPANIRGDLPAACPHPLLT
ncbi:sodium phosphate symporter [Raphidocelis subcapitata]|uniref:Phosphate transporter n=1 Tax=Raphidocelis subcapitata TaxID=307507 RepID=A0A2V0NPS4_9CHLO|nr:sodium phosphate symporter [Raphidocelis subcapitata]|eukprot:GBF87500.1 sodium phosphate symporter [Raphidocelis subcapitata]